MCPVRVVHNGSFCFSVVVKQSCCDLNCGPNFLFKG